MRRTNRWFLASLVTTAALLACSSDDSSGDEPRVVTPESACEHEYRARIERCHAANIPPATAESLRTRYVADCVATLALKGMTRTSANVEACAAATEAEACGAAWQILPACLERPGELETGAACNVSAQCASGHCQLGERGKGCGKCVDTPAEGEECKADGSGCEPGTFCTGESGSNRLTCKRVRYVESGAPCNGFDLQCPAGSVCVTGEDGASSCVAGELGAPCRVDVSCGPGLFCNDVTWSCLAFSGEGEGCGQARRCAAGLDCDRVTRTCVALTFAEPGESCGRGVTCREGICGQGTGTPTCPEIVEDGEPCLVGAHMTCRAPAACIGGACVMPTTATCN